jgi:hypothetical protein
MENWFKTASGGRKVFYPWGNLNKAAQLLDERLQNLST